MAERSPVRTLVQPGTVEYPRILGVPAQSGGEIRVELPPGLDLLDGLRDVLAARRISSAAATLLCGSFDKVEYLTGGPDPSGQRVATYGPPTRLLGPVVLLAGNAIIGAAANGASFVHCHAVLVDADGALHGGHLPPGQSRLGADGAVAIVTVCQGAAFRVAFDAETNFALFGPTTSQDLA